MKRISGSHYFLDLFTNQRLTVLSLTSVRTSTWMEVSFFAWCVYVRRIYSSIAKDLKFNWSTQVMWKRSRWYSNTKADKYFSYYLFLPLSFIFTKQIFLGLFWIIIYSYLQTFFKIGVLKSVSQSTGNHQCRSFFLIS